MNNENFDNRSDFKKKHSESYFVSSDVTIKQVLIDPNKERVVMLIQYFIEEVNDSEVDVLLISGVAQIHFTNENCQSFRNVEQAINY